LPIFASQGSHSRQTSDWGPCRAVDLNRDGAIDFVVGSTYLRNTNSKGWPIRLANAGTLDAGRDPCFYDIDGDGTLDSVCLADGLAAEPVRFAWPGERTWAAILQRLAQPSSCPISMDSGVRLWRPWMRGHSGLTRAPRHRSDRHVFPAHGLCRR